MLRIEADMCLREKASKTSVTTPVEVADALTGMKEMMQECMVVLLLNLKNKLIDKVLVSMGTENSSLLNPSIVFRHAILKGAPSIILAHNHPSGDPTPSAEDIKVTKQIVECGNILHIKVLDHVIIGDTHLSLKETGLVDFNGEMT